MRKLIKLILLIINLILAVLMLASTMAGKIAPSDSMIVSLLSYGYLYFLIANALFVVVWLCFKSKWFLLSVVAIVARWSYVPLYFQVGGNEAYEPQEGERVLKVMTFNAHHFNGVELDGEGSDSNMLSFLEMVDEEQPDVLSMQEYIGKGGDVHLTQMLEERGYGHMASGYDNGSMTGEVVFSKLPIVRVVRIEGPSKLYVNLLWETDTLRLYCLHLNSYGLDESDHKQIENISHGNVDSLTGRSTLQKFRRTIMNHEREWGVLEEYFEKRNRMTIVAGDFNETPASYFYQQCRRYFDDSYCIEGQGFSTTYHGTFTKRRATTFPAYRIDMIVHTRDLQTVAYKRIKSEISDHHPVVVTVKIKN